jgi:hypothetical protein
MSRVVGALVGAAVMVLAWACASLTTEQGSFLGDVTYAEDVQPVLQARCSPCHAGESFGGTNFAVSYADMFLPSQLGPDLPVYRCAERLITSGVMPPNAGCTGDGTLDAGNEVCLTQAELSLVEIWVAEGAPE